MEINAILKKYLEIATLIAIPLGIYMLLNDYFTHDTSHLLSSILHAIFLAILLSGIVVTVHLSSIQFNQHEDLSADNIRVRQSRKIISKIDSKTLIERLRSDMYFGKMKMSNKDQSLVLKAGISLQSFGETITITPKRLNNTEIEYLVKSEPLIEFTVIDYGKNLKNVTRLEAILTENS